MHSSTEIPVLVYMKYIIVGATYENSMQLSTVTSSFFNYKLKVYYPIIIIFNHFYHQF